MKVKTLLVSLFIALMFISKVKAQDELVPPPPPPSITFDEKEEAKYLAKLKAETQAKLEKIKQYNANKYRYLLRDAYFKGIGNNNFWFKNNDEYFKRQVQITEMNIATEALAAEYHTADASKKKQLRKKLKTELGKLFDLRETERKEELARLEKEMEELRKSLKVRTEKKDQIIDRRIQNLLGEDDYLDWD